MCHLKSKIDYGLIYMLHDSVLTGNNILNILQLTFTCNYLHKLKIMLINVKLVFILCT